MTTKNIISLLIFITAGVFYFNFVAAFKFEMVDNVLEEHENLQTAFNQAKDQLSLTKLKEKKSALNLQEVNILENFVPARLKSGTFVYNLAQFANQNRLTLKGMQYTVVKDLDNDASKDKLKKLMIEFTMDGRYEDFISWIQVVENANTLVTVESIRGIRNSTLSDIITFNVRMSVFAQEVD